MGEEVRTTSSTGGEKGVKPQRFDLIPIFALTKLAEHYGAGARKYDDHQWRKGYEYSKSYAALLRHLTAWWGGEDWDGCPKDESSCSNVDKDGNEWLFGGLVERGGKAIPICYNHTGGHHLDGVMWHAFALREFVEAYPEHDDRFKGE